MKTIAVKFLPLFLILAFPVCRSGGKINTTPQKAAEFSLTSPGTFTVLTTSGKARVSLRELLEQNASVQINVHTVSQIRKYRITASPDISRSWGKNLEAYYKKKGAVAKYIPLSRVPLSPFDKELFGSYENWLRELGISKVFVVRQKELIFDHSTRLPRGGFLQFLYTVFLWADAWWIDGMGAYFLYNESELAVYDLDSGRELGRVSGLATVAKSNIRRFSTLNRDMDDIIDTSVEQIVENLGGVL